MPMVPSRSAGPDEGGAWKGSDFHCTAYGHHLHQAQHSYDESYQASVGLDHLKGLLRGPRFSGNNAASQKAPRQQHKIASVSTLTDSVPCKMAEGRLKLSAPCCI